MSTTNNEKIEKVLNAIGKGYRLIRLVGHGSVGAVYECEDSTGKHVAVKLMEISPMMDPNVLEGIIQAALATRSLSENVNVVQVLAAGRVKDFYFILMQMINGGTLETVVENKNVSLQKKMGIAVKIAEILAAIHSKGIVHQDLKPSNVLLDDTNTPYLNDFYLFPRDGNSISAMPHGTPYYMSPEQTDGQLVTALTDVYSFGVLFYELLTNSMPYAETPHNIADMIAVVNEGKIIRPSRKNRKIDMKLEAVILKLLEKDQEKRYRKMETVVADIRACIDKKKLSFSYKSSIIGKIWHLFR